LLKLVTDDTTWDEAAFAAAVEGMCDQVEHFPHLTVPFIAHTTPEVVFLFFALWKMGKTAFPLSTRLPAPPEPLFVPQMPQPKNPKYTSWKEGTLATQLYTSGSTAAPKIACHTLANHIYSALGSNTLTPLEKDDRWLLSLPLFHVGGIAILFRCYLSGATAVISSKPTGITHLSLVPTQLLRMGDVSSFKCILLGGAPLPQNLPSNCKTTYGMTEMSSQIVTDHQILPHTEMKIADDGEILVRGKTLFHGYLDEEFDRTAWFPTRDLGRWTHDGKFEVLGRKDNMFISGGENIQPEEIEAILKAVPGVEEAVVVPLTDPTFGARPALLMRPLLPLETIHALLKPHLPKFKWPIKAELLPLDTPPKINRHSLAHLLIE
jgi:O-succinylbenzoic acid--CoA ligase